MPIDGHYRTGRALKRSQNEKRSEMSLLMDFDPYVIRERNEQIRTEV
jgi:hypothetical protein